VPYSGRRKSDIPVREKVDFAAQMQRYGSDNQVSCTADFDPDGEAGDVPRILEAYEDRLKGIVFLPAVRHGYEQPPYEEISKGRYHDLARKVTPIEGNIEHEHEFEARYCDGEICELT
jgi:hypothetical protein